MVDLALAHGDLVLRDGAAGHGGGALSVQKVGDEIALVACVVADPAQSNCQDLWMGAFRVTTRSNQVRPAPLGPLGCLT